MRTVWKLALALCLVAVPASLAQVSQTELLRDLPPCAVTCLIDGLANSSCLPTNRTCTCTDISFEQEVTNCVLKACTIKEALSAKNLTSAAYCNNPIRNRALPIVIVSNAIGIIGCCCIIQRLLFKFFLKIGYDFDDWFILITGVSSIAALIVIQCGLAASGLGKDVWTVPFNSLTNFGKYFYVLATLYFSQLTFLKMSMLFFYLRIFPNRIPRLLLWGTITFNALCGIAFIIVVIFQCRPISYFWNQWDGEHKGMCCSINLITWSNALISVILDFWMLAIPLSQLNSLNMDWKRKVGVGLMFFVGTGVTVISIIRLCFLKGFGKTANQTWDFTEVTHWSIIEIGVGEICICMPSIRSAFLYFFPKALEKAKGIYNKFTTGETDPSVHRGNVPRTRTGPKKYVKGHSEIISQSYIGSYDEGDEMELVNMKQKGEDSKIF